MKDDKYIHEGVKHVLRSWSIGTTIGSTLDLDSDGNPNCFYKLISVINWGRSSVVYKAEVQNKSGSNEEPIYCALKFMSFPSFSRPDVSSHSSPFNAEQLTHIESESSMIALTEDIPYIIR